MHHVSNVARKAASASACILILEVQMESNSESLLAAVIGAAEKASALVESWRDDEGNLQKKLVPFGGDLDDLDMLAIDLESASDEVLEVADGIRSGKRDSAELSMLLAGQEEIDADLENLSDRGGARDARRVISDLFAKLKVAADGIADSLRGRRDFYIYVHKTKEGKVFYVGKGTGKRAWSPDRHALWRKFVNERLDGRYDVEIVMSNLTEHEALEREGELIRQYGSELVNWLPGEPPGISISFDPTSSMLSIARPDGGGDAAYYEAVTAHNRIREEIAAAVDQARPLEKIDPGRAITLYRSSVARLDECAQTSPRNPGLKGELSGPWCPLGVDLAALDRMTLLLLKGKQYADVVELVDAMRVKYPGALPGSVVGQRISARRERAVQKMT
jgi:hypothetical protein